MVGLLGAGGVRCASNWPARVLTRARTARTGSPIGGVIPRARVLSLHARGRAPFSPPRHRPVAPLSARTTTSASRGAPRRGTAPRSRRSTTVTSGAPTTSATGSPAPRDDAADATQETFLKVLERLPGLADRELNFGSYLLTAARHASYDAIERRSRAAPAGEIPDSAVPVAAAAPGPSPRAARAARPTRRRSARPTRCCRRASARRWRCGRSRSSPTTRSPRSWA